jgi:hypothetical protein
LLFEPVELKLTETHRRQPVVLELHFIRSYPCLLSLLDDHILTFRSPTSR